MCLVTLASRGMQESCTSQSWSAGFYDGEGNESHPLHRMPIEQDMQNRLFLIHSLAKFSSSRVLFAGSTNDLPGPRYLRGAHHHSHYAISSPSPQIYVSPPFLPTSLSHYYSQKSLPLGFVLNSRGCQSVLSLVQGSASCPVLELCSRTLLQVQETFCPFADSHSSFRRAKPP